MRIEKKNPKEIELKKILSWDTEHRFAQDLFFFLVR